MRPGFQVCKLAGVAIFATTTLAYAQDPDDLKRGVARLSLANGEVSIQRGDSKEWVAAAVNAPVVSNDRIATGANSRAEIQFDSGNMLRLGGNTDVTLTQLESNRYQIAVGHGTVNYRLLRTAGAAIELDTPSVSVRPSRVGNSRITVNDAGESEITARTGDVEVFTPRGSQWINSGQTMQARGAASDPEFQIAQAAAPDEWDHWNDSRDHAYTASASTQYVPPGVYGAEDLDPYGNWVNVQPYGYVWQPAVAAGWAPYRAGRWVWLDWYGWTWVSYDPWGWAPYHYGRWFYQAGYGWCWYPGVIGVRHYWSPALVAFFGFGGGGVAVGFGNVGWVPLAPYEVFHPWWGRAYYEGPAYVNRQVAVVNVNVTNVYHNARVVNGYTAVSGADFRAGRVTNFVRPSAGELAQASMARGPIPVAPDRASYHFSERPAGFVPHATATPPAYRQPVQVPRGQQVLPSERSQSGWTRFNAPSGQGATPQTVNPAPRNESSSWQRFGAAKMPEASPHVDAPLPRAWSRFGEPHAGQPGNPASRTEFRSGPQTGNYAVSPGNRPEPLHIAPQVVRERSTPGYGGGGSGNNRAPSGSGARRAPSNDDGGNRGGRSR